MRSVGHLCQRVVFNDETAVTSTPVATTVLEVFVMWHVVPIRRQIAYLVCRATQPLDDFCGIQYTKAMFL